MRLPALAFVPSGGARGDAGGRRITDRGMRRPISRDAARGGARGAAAYAARARGDPPGRTPARSTARQRSARAPRAPRAANTNTLPPSPQGTCARTMPGAIMAAAGRGTGAGAATDNYYFCFIENRAREKNAMKTLFFFFENPSTRPSHEVGPEVGGWVVLGLSFSPKSKSQVTLHSCPHPRAAAACVRLRRVSPNSWPLFFFPR